MRLGRGQDEDGVRRRLFQSLQEGVPGLVAELVGLVDDVHAIRRLVRSVADLFAQIANVVHAAGGGSVNLDQVQGPTLSGGDAQRAGVAWVAICDVGAVDGTEQDAGGAGLAGAARAGEEIGVRWAAELDRVAQGAGDVLLADDLFEPLGAPAQIQDAPVGRFLSRGVGGRWELIVEHTFSSPDARRPIIGLSRRPGR